MSALVVRNNPEELRYEALRDDQLVGLIRYRTEPGVVVLVHTEVDEAVEGTGVGSQLVRVALDDLRARGLRLVPLCPFVAAYLRRHPEYAGPRGRRPGDAGMSEPTPERERGPHKVYASDAIEVHWEPRLCIHVRNCVNGLGAVFDPERRPWIEVCASDPDEIAATVLTCPTGALPLPATRRRCCAGGARPGDDGRAAAERPSVRSRPRSRRRPGRQPAP